jgi:hypothetical protein
MVMDVEDARTVFWIREPQKLPAGQLVVQALSGCCELAGGLATRIIVLGEDFQVEVSSGVATTSEECFTIVIELANRRAMVFALSALTRLVV